MTQTLPPLSMFAQLLSASASAAQAKAAPRQWLDNPFPPGMHEGSATSKVLAELRRVAPQSVEHGQLRFNLNASRGMVTRALKYLEAQFLVSRVHDGNRTLRAGVPSYLRRLSAMHLYTPARCNNSLTLICRQRQMRSRLMMVMLCSPRSIPPI